MKALLIYSIILSLLSSYLLKDLRFLRLIPRFHPDIFPLSFLVSVITRVQDFGGCLRLLSMCRTRVVDREREGNARSGRKKVFLRLCAKLFWRMIYYANPKPKPDSQSRSLSCRGLGRRAPQIIR